MYKLIILSFVICSLFIFGVSSFNYQEIQYENNACTGNFIFKIKTTQCSEHGYIRKVNDTTVMLIPIKNSAECVESNDGSPKPSPTPTPTPTNNNSTTNGTNNNSTSTELSSSSHHNSTSNELSSSHHNSTSTELSSSSHHNNSSTELSSSHSNNTNHNSNSTDSSNSISNEPYTPPTYYKINECNVLPDGTSLFVTIQEEKEEHPFKEMGFCNDIELLDNNCDNPIVRTYKNFTCVPLGKNENGIAYFQRISCRANLQSIDYDYCLHDCTNINCNYNETKPSGVFLCPDIETIDTSNNGANSLLHSTTFNYMSIILSFSIYFILYI